MLRVICKMHYVPHPRIHHHSLHSTKHVNFVLLRRASRISWIHMCRHSAHAQYPHSKGRCYAWEGTNTNQINTIKLRKLHWYYVQSCWPTIVYHQHSTLFWVFITTHDLFIYDCHTVSWTKSLTFFFPKIWFIWPKATCMGGIEANRLHIHESVVWKSGLICVVQLQFKMATQTYHYRGLV